MNQTNQVSEKDPITYPTKRIFAIFDEHHCARRTASILFEEGFRPAEVDLLSNLVDRQKLNSGSGETGLLAKLATYGLEKRDREYVTQYRQALLDGKLVLAIVDKGEQLRDHVRHILKSQRAHSLVLFDGFIMEVLDS
jgi:hypothetical protein